MNTIKELERQFFEIENKYAANEFNARRKGNRLREDYWRKKREINTHIHFLFLFTRLEKHIKEQIEKLINNKKSRIVHWKTKSIWEITDIKNLHFKKMLALLTEKGRADFNIIVDYYDKRNEIAHGGTIQNINTSINMINFFANIKRFLKELKR